jgi:heptosyltransferase-3
MPMPASANASRKIPAPSRILVITLRRLGDVLLTTPLIRTLRRGYPRAQIDVLAFRGGDRILAGNPDIGAVLTMPERPTARETAALIGRLWRRYDLVVSTQSGDRPTFYALIAGRHRIGLVPPAGQTGARWKRHAYHVAIAPEPETHRIAHLRQLTDALGLQFVPELVCPQGGQADPLPRAPYAVVHANPAYRYKRWTSEGWCGLVRAFDERGLTVVATGGANAAERAYLDELWSQVETKVVRLDGRLDWPGLARLLSGAAVYVGVDTSMTHLAAAAGCPTVALYGPTSPRLIGPWPLGGLAKPWEPAGTIQQRGNVQVVQNPLPCLPCEKLGCAGHLDSHARCLDELSVRQVLAAVDRALGRCIDTPAQVSDLAAPGSSNGP